MKPTTFLVHAIMVSLVVTSAENEPCFGEAGRAGVCVSTSACTSSGGKSVVGACPGTPDNIRCCTKSTCTISTSTDGNCRWTSDCTGTEASNQCPGPSQFKCCSSSSAGFGGYDQPPAFGTGGCAQVAIRGANKIVDAFPGRIREIGCKRSGSSCEVSKPSDHCSGMATDMMDSDGGGQASMGGREIAEWVMRHRSELSLKYVIWGQKIWEAGEAEKDWEDWEDMEDRENLTKNHWDHVHVSYKS